VRNTKITDVHFITGNTFEHTKNGDWAWLWLYYDKINPVTDQRYYKMIRIKINSHVYIGNEQPENLKGLNGKVDYITNNA
jgi:hypothetical protein